jgi:hypothetical protein
LIATKLTFLSIILALGMFQYKYFYDETKEVDERIEKGDFGPGWLEYVRQAQETQRIVEAEATQLLQAQKILNGVTKTGNENQQLDVGSLRASLQERTQKLEQVRRTLSEMNSKIQSVKAEWEEFSRSILIDFAFRLALIFAIAFLVFASLIFDIVAALWQSALFNSVLYSQSTFLASLVLLFILFCLFLVVVQRQFRYFNIKN